MRKKKKLLRKVSEKNTVLSSCSGVRRALEALVLPSTTQPQFLHFLMDIKMPNIQGHLRSKRKCDQNAQPIFDEQ
jgi:hypothetical protein